jgi:hypothetical protein
MATRTRKKKADLVEEALAEDNLLESEEDDLVVDEADGVEAEAEDDLPHEDIPLRNSPEWSDYVISLLVKGEYVDQIDKKTHKEKRYPTVAGLRRVSEMLLGEIVESRPTDTTVIAVPGPIGYIASVTYVVVFRTGNGLLTYGDAADVNQFNCSEPYAFHATATAATRAEARALRKALKLRCIAAEELDGGAANKAPIDTEPRLVATEPDVVKDEFISEPIIRFIDTKCQQLNIDVFKFINLGKGSYSSINQVTLDTGEEMLRAIKDFMNDKELINSEILGYSENWRNE